MGKARFFARPLSWVMTKLSARDARELEALRLSLSGSETRQQPSALIEAAEDLRWTCR